MILAENSSQYQEYISGENHSHIDSENDATQSIPSHLKIDQRVWVPTSFQTVTTALVSYIPECVQIEHSNHWVHIHIEEIVAILLPIFLAPQKADGGDPDLEGVKHTCEAHT